MAARAGRAGRAAQRTPGPGACFGFPTPVDGIRLSGRGAYSYTWVLSVSSTEEVIWSLTMLTLKRTSPALTPLAITR